MTDVVFLSILIKKNIKNIQYNEKKSKFSRKSEAKCSNKKDINLIKKIMKKNIRTCLI